VTDLGESSARIVFFALLGDLISWIGLDLSPGFAVSLERDEIRL
jgi:hypothetical protein